jgi:hypothetical protein
MSDTRKDDSRIVFLEWVIIVLVVLLGIGLVAFARGPDHRRGDEIGEGSIGAPVLVIGP